MAASVLGVIQRSSAPVPCLLSPAFRKLEHYTDSRPDLRQTKQREVPHSGGTERRVILPSGLVTDNASAIPISQTAYRLSDVKVVNFLSLLARISE